MFNEKKTTICKAEAVDGGRDWRLNVKKIFRPCRFEIGAQDRRGEKPLRGQKFNFISNQLILCYYIDKLCENETLERKVMYVSDRGFAECSMKNRLPFVKPKMRTEETSL